MATATFRGVSQNNGVSSATVTKPTGTATGDYLLAVCYATTAASFGAPSGWHSMGAGPNIGGLTSNPSWIFFKFALATEPSSYTFTVSAGASIQAFVAAYYNTAGVDVERKTASSGSVSSLAASSVTTTQNTETGAVFSLTEGSSTLTAPAGVSVRLSGQNLLADYAGPSTPGSSARGTATASPATGMAAITLALLSQVPGAPTLLGPANSSYADLAATGGPFSWAYNGVTSETGYHFRRKISGGSYTYWNAGTSAFQSTDVANTSTAQSLTFGAGVFTDGNTYNSSVASVDTNGLGPYAADWTVTAQLAPSVTILTPTGTVVNTQYPPITWSASLASGATQGTYRLVTYTAAQYGASGFTPGSGPSADDSGVVTSAATSYTPANALPNSTSFESYVQLTESPGGKASAWA